MGSHEPVRPRVCNIPLFCGVRHAAGAGLGLLALLLLCLAVPSVAGAAVTLQTLNLNAKTGPENYVFTAGNTIVAQGKVDAADQNHLGRSYRFVFTDPTGAVRGMTACTPAGAAGGAVSGSYTVQPSDPVSTSATWKVLIRQYVDQGCASLEKASGALAYNVAGSTSWSSSALTTQQSIFGPGGTGYLKVAGLTSSKADWITTWQLPSGATACANSAAADRPDSDANGSLPTGAGAFLQYAPGVALGAAWNLQANYDAACPAFSAANEGRWSVTLKKDATHFVTLPSFSVDATAPSSSASSAATVSSESIKVAYSASESGPTPSGLSKVELYAKGPADSGYGKVATDSSPSGSGSFDYTGPQSDDSYSFYTVSTDNVGPAEAAPSSADSTTVVDTAAPISQASSPQYSPSNGFTVGYTATAGMARVALYAKAPGDSGYTKVGTDSAPGTSGSFSYTAAAGEGSYSFYTVATSKGGKSETPPSDPDSVTLVDTTAPASQASSPQRTTADSFKVSYTADDPGGSPSGLARVDLYVKGPTDDSYSKVATDSAPGASGSFDYTVDGSNGDYSFYTVATDKADKAEAPPGSPDTVTTVEVPDNTAPGSSASSPAYLNTSLFTVSYSASDRGGGATGVAKVDLYAKAPGDSGYSKVATDATPSDYGSFSYLAAAGDGSYSFYTLATDNAGNVQEEPAEADATTWLDTGLPVSQASSPQSPTSNNFNVSYAASDPGPAGSGVAKVELYARGPGDSSYVKVGTDVTPGATGSFNYTASGGGGSYDFYTVATDKAGNAEPEPSSADTTTTVDATSPQSQAGSAQYATASGFAVSYAASDPGPGASGVASVELYAKAPGESSYSKVATDLSPGASGSFDYTAAAGDGGYSFYTVATDKAGNTEAAPSVADTTTRLDGTPPTSSASSPANTSASSFAVSYTASDPGSDVSGLTKVELYAKGPRDSTYAKAATDSSPAASGSFDYTATAGSGSYSFYTVATDVAGNTEAAPSSPDSTTSFDPTGGQPTLHVAKQNPNCLDQGAGTATQPFCSIKPATLKAVAGQTVLVHSGTYNETVTVGGSGTASDPITYAAAAGDNVTVSGGASGFILTGMSYVVVQGFNVTGTTGDGIVAKTSSHITLRGNHVTNAGQPVSTKIAKGFRREGTTDSLVTKNTIDHNSDYGLYLVAGSNRNQVVANDVFSNARVFQRAASGIRVHSSHDNKISSNLTHHNEDSGTEVVTGASNNLVVNNASYSNGDHGIDVTNNALNQRVISNSIYDNTTAAGINVEGTSTGATLRNNIAVDNATDPLRRTSGNIRVEQGSTLGTTLDYDIAYQHVQNHNYNWNGLGYYTLKDMQLVSSQEAHALEADPQWTSASTGDLSLRLGSPAIDSAESDANGEAS